MGPNCLCSHSGFVPRSAKAPPVINLVQRSMRRLLTRLLIIFSWTSGHVSGENFLEAKPRPQKTICFRHSCACLLLLCHMCSKLSFPDFTSSRVLRTARDLTAPGQWFGCRANRSPGFAPVKEEGRRPASNTAFEPRKPTNRRFSKLCDQATSSSKCALWPDTDFIRCLTVFNDTTSCNTCEAMAMGRKTFAA